MSAANSPGWTRREFVRTVSGAAAAPLVASPLLASAPPAKRRYAMIGTGDRGTGMWGEPLVERYADVLEFVGLCDINPKRAVVAASLLGVAVPDLHELRRDVRQGEARPAHGDDRRRLPRQYIVKALDRGIDVITEKPMVIDEKQCQAVLDAEKRNKRKIIVTFNYRYAPKHQLIKETLLSGEIGRIISVDFSWYLDVYHGADYFRRWHRLKARSGSLWVHKATHHFDLINWWLAADPVEVTARAGLEVYGKNGTFRHTHCRACPHRRPAAFYYDMTPNARRMKLYAGCEERRRLLPRRLRLPRGRRHLRHDVGAREVLERRDHELLGQRVHADRGLPPRVQRREGPAGGARLRAAAVDGRGPRPRST